jgi:hypothetical protein
VTCLNAPEFDVLIRHQKQRLEKAIPRAAVTMSKDVGKGGLDFAKFLSGLSPVERARGNELNRKEALEQHKTFQEKFKAGSRCDEPGARDHVWRPRPCAAGRPADAAQGP